MDQAQRDAAVKAAFEAYENGRTVADEAGRKRPKPYDEIFNLWEAMWTAADFSWEGLADAGWERGHQANQAQLLKQWQAPSDFPGGGAVQGEGDAAFKPATLQDYWRWVPNAGWGEDQGWVGGRLASDDELKAKGLLVEHDGQLWHVLHQPKLHETDIAGSISRAADLQSGNAPRTVQKVSEQPAARTALEIAVAQRLALAESGANAVLSGTRAQGLDAFLRAFVAAGEAHRALYLSAPLSAFSVFDLSTVNFGKDTNFAYATFGPDAMFMSTFFGDRASFYNATLARGAVFSRATFGGEASFMQTTFGGSTFFMGATFGGWACFVTAIFGDWTVFESSIFEETAGFGGAVFGADANFDKAIFRMHAQFDESQFGDRAYLANTRFRGFALYRSSRFGDRAIFACASFEDGAYFDSAVFGEAVVFESATFNGDAFFGQSTFGDNAVLGSVTFEQSVDFCSATFVAKLAASGVVFKGRFQMRAAEIKGYADFSGGTWPEKLEDQHAAFRGCRFRDVADFQTKDFSAFALFDGAEFSGRVLLTDPQEKDSDRLFHTAISAGAKAVEADRAFAKDLASRHRKWAAQEKPDPNAEPKDAAADERGGDARFGALSGGLRTLKLAMAAQGDLDREQRSIAMRSRRGRRSRESRSGRSSRHPFMAGRATMAAASGGPCGG